ncbi:hypothetical protein ACIA03_29285 [Nocardioides sp. NPDC051685]|uniref:hypothetical protein n=1 Tax=Nocardioides sp. NPDC051685 TaxID=3364334 RepID=UPI00378A4948
MAQKPDNQTGGGLLLGAGAALLMILCCAGPALIAGGALAGIGGLLRNPWVIGAGIAVLALAVLSIARRRSGATNDCCTPTRHADSPADSPADTTADTAAETTGDTADETAEDTKEEHHR